MDERQRSPYTGRPVDEWLTQEIELYDAGGDEIGKVVEINPDFIVAERDGGFLGLGERRAYYILRDQIARQDEDDWHLSIDKDQIELMGWTEPPNQSEWSQEHDRDRAVAAKQRRGGTRIRRYEEDLEAHAVQRQAGEVVVNKNVVEDTRSIDVPVRREEVHVERHPASGDASVMADRDDKAFTEDSIRVPVMEEDVEVRKVVRPVEEVEITKSQTEGTRRVEDTVRREEIDVADTTEKRY